MRLIFLLGLIFSPLAAFAAAPSCSGILTVAETHRNRWQWTRDSVNEMRNTDARTHPWEWLYLAPLTILAAPGDVLAMPFRPNGVYLRGSISGSIVDANGGPLADYPWKAWPWKYQDHQGQKPLKGWVRSYHRACTTDAPCRAEETQTDQFEFGTNSEGSFVFTFEGFVVHKGYLEVYFGPPLDRTIRIVREKKGKFAAREPISGEEICQLTMHESAASTPAK